MVYNFRHKTDVQMYTIELIKLIDQHICKMEAETMARTIATEGMEQGKAEALTAAKQDAVLILLEFRFGDVSESVTDQVRSIHDHTRLDNLYKDVSNTDSLDKIDFQIKN